MRISTKGKYGLAAMVYLGEKESSPEPVTVATISGELNISKIYLEQIFSLLKKQNLVSSVKGSQGGYFLADKADKITVLKILQGIETGLFEKTEAFLSEDYSHIGKALDQLVWENLDKAVLKTLEETTLKDLIENSRKNLKSSASMFYI